MDWHKLYFKSLQVANTGVNFRKMGVLANKAAQLFNIIANNSWAQEFYQVEFDESKAWVIYSLRLEIKSE